MAITLNTLIRVAAFPDKERDSILANIEKLSKEQKERLIHAAWFSIVQMYNAQLEYEQNVYRLETQQGKKEYHPEELKKIQEKLMSEFTNKLKSAETDQSINDIRQELQKHLNQNNPLSSPPHNQPASK